MRQVSSEHNRAHAHSHDSHELLRSEELSCGSAKVETSTAAVAGTKTAFAHGVLAVTSKEGLQEPTVAGNVAIHEDFRFR